MAEREVHDEKKLGHDSPDRSPSAASQNSNDGSTVELTAGVQKIEEIAQSWSFKALVVAWIGVFLLAFSVSLDAQTIYSYQPFATSAFAAHSLLGTVNTIQNILYAVTKPPIAKLADVFGRFEAFTIAIVLITIGFIMNATSQSIGAFAGGQIFYVAGQVGIQFMQQIFAVDTTTLRNRALFSILPLTPFLATPWIGSEIVSKMVPDNWRWGYGMWAILVPATSLPLLGTLAYHQFYAVRKYGVKRPSLLRRPYHLFKELDFIGLLLFTAGLTLFLLPFTLAALSGRKWSAPHIIAMLVVGSICLLAFPFWEIYSPWAKRAPILRLQHLKDRTITFGCGVAFMMFAAFYIYQPYFYSYLVVARGHSYKAATNISLSSIISSTASGIVAAFVVKYTGNFKWVAVFGGAVKLIGGGLMLHYRNLAASTGQVVAAQVIAGIGQGIMVPSIQVGVQACVGHQDVASVTAILLTLNSVGGAVGDAISGGLWTNLLPKKLAENMPVDFPAANITMIKDSFITASSFALGSPEREGVVKSYDQVMQLMLKVSLGFTAFPILLALGMRNINLKEEDEKRHYDTVLIGNSREKGRDANRLEEERTADGGIVGTREPERKVE